MNEYTIESLKRFGPKEGQYGEYYIWKMILEGIEGEVSYFDNTGAAFEGFGQGDTIKGNDLIEKPDFEGKKQWKLIDSNKKAYVKPNKNNDDLADIKAKQDRILNGIKEIYKILNERGS